MPQRTDSFVTDSAFLMLIAIRKRRDEDIDMMRSAANWDADGDVPFRTRTPSPEPRHVPDPYGLFPLAPPPRCEALPNTYLAIPKTRCWTRQMSMKWAAVGAGQMNGEVGVAGPDGFAGVMTDRGPCCCQTNVHHVYGSLWPGSKIDAHAGSTVAAPRAAQGGAAMAALKSALGCIMCPCVSTT